MSHPQPRIPVEVRLPPWPEGTCPACGGVYPLRRPTRLGLVAPHALGPEGPYCRRYADETDGAA